jgi:SP family general alpha glucoside:H+ symporter-like MFS transporter
MVNPTYWNWRKLTAFFWAGICFLCIIYTYFRIPEPAGRSFAELDVLFERGVSARKFKETNVDVFGTEESEHAGKMSNEKGLQEDVKHEEKV